NGTTAVSRSKRVGSGTAGQDGTQRARSQPCATRRARPGAPPPRARRSRATEIAPPPYSCPPPLPIAEDARGLVAIEVSQRNVLLLHDGELADVRALVEDLGVRAIEAREPPGEDYEFAVVLASARHLREVHRVGRGPQVVRIAVLDHDARTLRALCRRAGVDLIVRRPVHPLAVRLLLLH